MSERYRSLTVVFVLFVVGFFAIAYCRMPSQRSGVPVKAFWPRKVLANPIYDVVFLGDSRTYRGISTDDVEKSLPGRKVLNFGFANRGLDPAYLEAGCAKFRPRNRKKALVMGVTPNSFTNRAFNYNNYRGKKNKRREDAFSDREVAWMQVMNHIRPFDWKDVQVNLGLRPLYKKEVYHDGGWVESHSVRVSPDSALKSYGRIFNERSITQENFEASLVGIKAIIDRGIYVFAYRPPTTHKMVALEDENSGFHEPTFVKRFEEIGGVWFDFSVDDYSSYDGSHLIAESAAQFSRDVGTLIRPILEQKRRKKRPPNKGNKGGNSNKGNTFQ